MGPRPGELTILHEAWMQCWPSAVACWSRYTRLSDPVWCYSREEEKNEGLTGSFAMIRLADHRVVISLRQIHERKLGQFAREILAHEVGHHVYCPADLTDNCRMLARLQFGLPGKEHLAAFIGNLYTDLLINDRLQRWAELSMAGVYCQLNAAPADRLWRLYMRTYELLWRLPTGTLASGEVDVRVNCDAQLAGRLIRSYANDWLAGAGRFAALCLPYLTSDEAADARRNHEPLNDTQKAGDGVIPCGLAEIDDNELTGAIHPAGDPDISAVPSGALGREGTDDANDIAGSAEVRAGFKSIKHYRGPLEYARVIKASALNVAEGIITARYYTERALPYLVGFPEHENPAAEDVHPEGLDVWEIGSPVEQIDWLATLTASVPVIPGVTTVERVYSTDQGSSAAKTPMDLYLGVDCSGSMGNPAHGLSYPVLAAAVMALSALRAGSRVLAALSGEPGNTVTTDGFTRDRDAIMATLTGYLGTGTTFGIHRLAKAFPPGTKSRRISHIVIVTDNDIFSLLDRIVDGRLGWDVAREAAEVAGGGASYVLQLPGYLMASESANKIISAGEKRMVGDGWNVAHVNTAEELLAFARNFSNVRYGSSLAGRRIGK